jgi:RNA-binding protein 39
MPTPQFVLKNMFDPSEAAKDPDFHLDIQEDVTEECSKYGPVKHCAVDRNSQGCVYIKMHTPQAAQQAMGSLHGRWFGGKMVTAEFVPDMVYNQKFPAQAGH